MDQKPDTGKRPEDGKKDKVDDLIKALWPNECQPAAEFVDGAALLRELTISIRRFVVIPINVAQLLAIWILAAWCFTAFDIFPRLAIVSPVMRCGKTTLLAVLECLVRRPLNVSSITPAAFYRVVEIAQPVLLLDEMDALLRGDKERAEALRGVLNSGHKSAGRVVLCDKQSHKVKTYRTYAPAVTAGIGKQPATWMDRSIPIVLHRKTDKESVRAFRREARLLLESLGEKCARWAADHRHLVEASYHGRLVTVPAELNDRQADNAEPLLCVARLCSPRWEQRIRAAVLALREPTEVQADASDIQLLVDAAYVTDEWAALNPGLGKIPTDVLLGDLLALPESDWNSDSKGKPLTAKGLANKLKTFKINPPRQFKSKGDPVRGYVVAEIRAAASRYAPNPDVLPVTPSVATSPEENPGQVTGNGSDGGMGASSSSLPPSGSTLPALIEPTAAQIESRWAAHKLTCASAEVGVRGDGGVGRWYCTACGHDFNGHESPGGTE